MNWFKKWKSWERERLNLKDIIFSLERKIIKINNILGVYNFALKEKYIEMNESKRNKSFKIFKHI